MAQPFISLATQDQIQSQLSPIVQQNPVYPWFTEKQVAQLENDTSHISDPIEKQQKKNDIYRQVLPIIKERARQTEKSSTTNTLFANSLNETDPVKQKQVQTTVRIGTLADKLRQSAWLPSIVPDNEVIWAFIGKDQTKNKQMIDYMNGTNEDILTMNGLKEVLKPVENNSTILWDIWGWLAKSATSTAEVWSNIWDYLGYHLIKNLLWEEVLVVRLCV